MQIPLRLVKTYDNLVDGRESLNPTASPSSIAKDSPTTSRIRPKRQYHCIPPLKIKKLSHSPSFKIFICIFKLFPDLLSGCACSCGSHTNASHYAVKYILVDWKILRNLHNVKEQPLLPMLNTNKLNKQRYDIF